MNHSITNRDEVLSPPPTFVTLPLQTMLSCLMHPQPLLYNIPTFVVSHTWVATITSVIDHIRTCINHISKNQKTSKLHFIKVVDFEYIIKFYEQNHFELYVQFFQTKYKYDNKHIIKILVLNTL